jgi:large subunit ribosomal protein L9
MKILLTQDVFKLGHAGEVKDVANGYGRNFLLPHGLAVLATPGALKRADALKEKALKARAAQQSEVEALGKVISGAVLAFQAKAGEKGKLFGSITAANIADKIQAHIGSEKPFDKRKVMLREPIREVGTHEVSVRLGNDVISKVMVLVTPEGQIVESGSIAAPAVEAAPAETAASA